MPAAAAASGPASVMMSVSIAPGQIALQVMPIGPYSKAVAFVNPLTACLVVM